LFRSAQGMALPPKAIALANSPARSPPFAKSPFAWNPARSRLPGAQWSGKKPPRVKVTPASSKPTHRASSLRGQKTFKEIYLIESGLGYVPEGPISTRFARRGYLEMIGTFAPCLNAIENQDRSLLKLLALFPHRHRLFPGLLLQRYAPAHLISPLFDNPDGPILTTASGLT